VKEKVSEQKSRNKWERSRPGALSCPVQPHSAPDASVPETITSACRASSLCRRLADHGGIL